MTCIVTDTLWVADEPVPVTVMVYVPVGVVASAARRRAEVPPAVIRVGVNVAVAAAGRPLADQVMVSGVLTVDVTATVVVPEVPWATPTVVGDALIEKAGALVTTNDTVVACVAEAAAPVMVTVYLPGAVVAPAASVSVAAAPAVMVAGANVAIAPSGTSLADMVTVSGVPAVDVVDTIVVPAPPRTTVMVVGDAWIENSGLAITTNDTVVAWVAEGAVPVIVTGYVPGGVIASAASVSVDEPPAVTLIGANVAIAPAGSPVADKLTVSAVPAVEVVDTAVVVERPWTTLTVVGDALIENSGRASTTNDTVVVWVADGAVPVIDTG